MCLQLEVVLEYEVLRQNKIRSKNMPLEQSLVCSTAYRSLASEVLGDTEKK